MQQQEHLTKEEATSFFAELYYGEHHIPNYEVKECGFGFKVIDDRKGEYSTTDYNNLTRFVLMCHKYGYRGSISAVKNKIGVLQIDIFKRVRGEGGLTESHPTIEQAIESFNKQ